MFNGVAGSSSVGSGSDTTGLASEMWVDQNYISKDFFNQLFTIHGHAADDDDDPPTDITVQPNDTQSIVDSIQAMVGLWTDEYLSALGLGEGGGSGSPTALSDLTDVSITNPVNGQVLVYRNSHWQNETIQTGGGTVYSITAGTGLSGGTITGSGTIAINSTYQNYISHGEMAYGWGDHSTQGYWKTGTGNHPTTLSGYGITDALGTSVTFWGQTVSNGAVTGNMTSVGDIAFSASGKNIGGLLYFDTTNGRIGVGTASPSYAFHVVGAAYIDGATTAMSLSSGTTIGAYGNITTSNGNLVATVGNVIAGTANGTYLQLGDIRIVYDSANDALKIVKSDGTTAAGLYATGFISALGVGTGGGGGSATALSDLTDVSISSPSAGQFLVYRNAHWTNESISSLSLTSLSAGSATISNALSANAITVGNTLTVTGAITSVMGGFNVSGKDNTYVLLAGGGTKLLSEIGGGSVNGIKIGTSATEYTPDANGIITLPAYPSNYVASISVNGGTPITPTSGNVGISGLAATVKVGSTSYAASSAGVVELPAYPSDTKNTAGSTALNATKLFIIGANSQAANPQTYSNTNCYIGTDNCLYSGGSKVLTGITSSDVTTALGFTPAATSDLNNYLPTSGGTLTNSAYGGQLTIKRSTSGGQAVIRFENNSGFLGSIGVTGAGIPVFGDETQDNVILHSGNVGTMGYLPLTGGTMTGAIKWPNNHRGVTNGWNIYTNNYGIEVLNAANVADAGAPSHYATALHVSGSYWFQLSFARGGLDDFLIRGGNNTGVLVSWQHLLHTGNYTDYVLPITGGNMSGNIIFNNGKAVLIKDTNGNNINAVYLTTDNRLYIGYGLATRTYQTRIYGTPLLFYTYDGTNSIKAMRINSNGNIGIATETPTQKLEVNGNIKATHVYNGDGNEYLTSASLSGYVQAIVVNSEQPAGPSSSGVVTLSGIVKKIKIGTSVTEYTPSAGVLTLPAYPSNYVSSISVNGGTPVTPTSGVVGISGLAATVKVGSTSYAASDAGVVELPAYPTVTDTKNTAGSTALNATKLFIIGANSQAANPQTYSNTNCYIGTDNCLYSGGSKVLTGITSSDVTTALGFTPAATSDLSNYLPLAGGEMSGRIKWATNSGNVADGWNIFTSNAGICIFNSTINGTGSKVRYSTALHVSGQYWFQLGHMRTTYDSLFYRAGTANGVTKDWSAFVFATGTSSQFIKGDGSLDSNTYLTSGDVVTVGTTQNITGSKTFTSKLTASAGCSFTGGLKAYSLCIESASDGTPSSSRSGEINRYNNSDLHLQYDTGTGGVTMCQNSLRVSFYQGIVTFDTGVNTPYITTAWQQGSDMRRKDIENYIDNVDVNAIAIAPIFDFRWKENRQKLWVGTSAQYWRNVLPNAVCQNPDGFLCMDYSATALASAVITARKVVDHERRIQELERENEYLREQIEDLKAAA